MDVPGTATDTDIHRQAVRPMTTDHLQIGRQKGVALLYTRHARLPTHAARQEGSQAEGERLHTW